MPLTDAKIRALHGKALKGEIVGKAADGGGLNFQNGKYWRMSYRFDGKQKTLALGVYPDISLKAAREARAKSTVWKWAKEGRIPAPHKEGNRFTYWLRTEVEAFACGKNLTNSNGTI